MNEMIRCVRGCGRVCMMVLAVLLAGVTHGQAQDRQPDPSQGGSAAVAAAAGTLQAEAETVVGNVFQFFEPVVESGLGGFFSFLGQQQFAFLMLALAIGYPLGRMKFCPISLGSTAGTLLAAVVLSMVADFAFGLTYSIPGLVSTIFLMMFMYALGLGVGPRFFAGLKAGGVAFIVIGLVVWSLNWLICFFGAKAVGLESGFIAGLISGSYTITAVLGVAQTAVQSGAAHLPDGLSAEQVGANMAAGYAISYILSSIFIVLLIGYLPKIFGDDAEADARLAEETFGGSTSHPLPGTPQAQLLGYSPYDIRAFRVEHDELIGRSLSELFRAFPNAPVLRVVRNGEIIPPDADPKLEKNDIITVRADVGGLILKGSEVVGPEVDDARARDLAIEAADIHVGSHAVSGKTLDELAHSIGFGVRLNAMFRGGNEIPFGPQSDVRFGDVLRLTGPDICVRRAAAALGGRVTVAGAYTEVMYMALAMFVGYAVGVFSVTLGGIPFALGTSAGCMLAGILVAYLRSRNPELGGPVSEGARSFLQDIGLNVFVAVLGANVGPKIISALAGDTVIWLALIGTTAALLPVVVAYVIGKKVFRLNSVINAGACAGARNSTPGLNGILDQSKSPVAAVAYPVPYAFTTVLALIGGYIAQILS